MLVITIVMDNLTAVHLNKMRSVTRGNYHIKIKDFRMSWFYCSRPVRYFDCYINVAVMQHCTVL